MVDYEQEYQRKRKRYGCEWFTEWFRKAIEEKGISLDEVSKRSNIGLMTIAYYYSGVRSPSLKTFMILLDAMGYELNITEK